MREVLIVGAGGFAGSVARYLLGGWVHRAFPDALFPYGTIVVNTLGCLAIGLLGGLAEFRQAFGPGGRIFLFIGVLGGFTTFSTFAYETLAFARDAETARAAANALLHFGLCLGAVALGHTASKALS